MEVIEAAEGEAVARYKETAALAKERLERSDRSAETDADAVARLSWVACMLLSTTEEALRAKHTLMRAHVQVRGHCVQLQSELARPCTLPVLASAVVGGLGCTRGCAILHLLSESAPLCTVPQHAADTMSRAKIAEDESVTRLAQTASECGMLRSY